LRGVRVGPFGKALAITTSLYLLIFNWYPFFKEPAYLPTALITDPASARAILASDLAWCFLYSASLFTLPYALAAGRVGAPFRAGLKDFLKAALPLLAALLALPVAIVSLALTSSGTRLTEGLNALYSVIMFTHAQVLSYALEFFIIPAAVPLAVVAGLRGWGWVKSLIREDVTALLTPIIASILTHDFLEPLVNLGVSLALIKLGGVPAAIPYYRGYGANVPKYLNTALQAHAPPLMPTWGMFAGLITYSLITGYLSAEASQH